MNNKLKRKIIDKEISKMVSLWANQEKDKIVNRVETIIKYKYHTAIINSINQFEKDMESTIQSYAHKKIITSRKESLIGHADRYDFKVSLRKHLRRCIINQLGYQKYFPELYNTEDTEGEK